MRQADRPLPGSWGDPSGDDTLLASAYVLAAHASMIASADLLRGRRLVLIEHHGAVYQLRATSQGKLILTK